MEDRSGTEFTFRYEVRNGLVIAFIEDFEVMRVQFNANNYGNALFEKLKHSDPYLTMTDEQRSDIYAQVIERLAEQGIKAEAETIRAYEPEALRLMGIELIKQSVDSSVELASKNLQNVVHMVMDKLLQATYFAGANDLRDILKAPEQKYSAKEIKEEIFQADWEQLKPLAGVTRGGKRNRKSEFTWDKEKAKQFYQTVQSLPHISKKPLWEYAQEQLRENDYDATTIAWLKSHPSFADCPDNLLREAATAWRHYDEEGKNIPPESKPLAFAFRHACVKLSYTEQAYNTLRKRYYEGKQESETSS